MKACPDSENASGIRKILGVIYVYINDENFLPPKIRNKPVSQQQQQNTGNNERPDNNSETDNDVIITGVSTYAQAAKVSRNTQSNKQGTTFIEKRVKFDKTGSKQTQSNFSKQPPTFQNNRNPRPPLLNNPPIQSINRPPVPEGRKQLINRPNTNYTNKYMPHDKYYQNRVYNPNLNRDHFLYQGQTPYKNSIAKTKPDIQIVNLSKRTLNMTEIKLLEKGLKFTPTPRISNIPELTKDISEFTRKIRLIEFFDGCEDKDDSLVRNKSNFVPPQGREELLDNFVLNTINIPLEPIEKSNVKRNISISEQKNYYSFSK